VQTVPGGRTPWRERRRYPPASLECERCGFASLNSDEIPFDTTTGRVILSSTFTGWTDAVLCKRCWWALNAEGRPAGD
jgi:hypothetical protein